MAGADPGKVRFGPSRFDVHDVVFFRRHEDDDSDKAAPGRDALNSWPTSVRANARAVLVAEAAAPSHRFSGGGYWEAIRERMSGWYEVRINGPKRHHYRLFSLLDYEAFDVAKPLLVVIDGRDKEFNRTLPEREHSKIRDLGEVYLAQNPRSVS